MTTTVPRGTNSFASDLLLELERSISALRLTIRRFAEMKQLSPAAHKALMHLLLHIECSVAEPGNNHSGGTLVNTTLLESFTQNASEIRLIHTLPQDVESQLLAVFALLNGDVANAPKNKITHLMCTICEQKHVVPRAAMSLDKPDQWFYMLPDEQKSCTVHKDFISAGQGRFFVRGLLRISEWEAPIQIDIAVWLQVDGDVFARYVDHYLKRLDGSPTIDYKFFGKLANRLFFPGYVPNKQTQLAWNATDSLPVLSSDFSEFQCVTEKDLATFLSPFLHANEDQAQAI